MKKAIAIAACVAAVLVSWGYIFHLMHWPGGFLTFFCGAVLAFISVILVMIQQLKQPGLKCTKLISGLSALLTIVAILFKVFHWPACSLLCLVAFVICVPLSAILLAIAYAKQD